MVPKYPLFEQHWHEFTMEHPEMLSRSRYVVEDNREEPELSIDIVAFLHFVRWAQRKGYGPPAALGLIPWVKGTYQPTETERNEEEGAQP